MRAAKLSKGVGDVQRARLDPPATRPAERKRQL